MGLTEKKDSRILARKRRSIRKKLWYFLRVFLIVIFFLGLLYGVNYFYNSSYFKINSIIINSNSHYSDEEILEHASELVGMNIFEIDKKGIEEKLVENLFWLKEVKLDKVFPNEVIFEIIERKPYITISYRSNYYLLDNEGVILEELVKDELDYYKNLILVRNAINYKAEAGEKIAKKSVLSCGEIYLTLDSEIKNEIKEAWIDDNYSGDIVFKTIEGKNIVFGNSKDIIQKNEILKQILNQLSKEDNNYYIIDLRNIENPIIK